MNVGFLAAPDRESYEVLRELGMHSSVDLAWSAVAGATSCLLASLTDLRDSARLFLPRMQCRRISCL